MLSIEMSVKLISNHLVSNKENKKVKTSQKDQRRKLMRKYKTK